MVVDKVLQKLDDFVETGKFCAWLSGPQEGRSRLLAQCHAECNGFFSSRPSSRFMHS